MNVASSYDRFGERTDTVEDSAKESTAPAGRLRAESRSKAEGTNGAGPPSSMHIRQRLEGIDDLSLDLQIRTLSGIEADLRQALEAARS